MVRRPGLDQLRSDHEWDPGICTPDGAYGLQEGNTDPEILVAVVSPS